MTALFQGLTGVMPVKQDSVGTAVRLKLPGVLQDRFHENCARMAASPTLCSPQFSILLSGDKGFKLGALSCARFTSLGCSRTVP